MLFVVLIEWGALYIGRGACDPRSLSGNNELVMAASISAAVLASEHLNVDATGEGKEDSYDSTLGSVPSSEGAL